MIATDYRYIVNVEGVPIIEGTRYKVEDIAIWYLSYGWSPDEIHIQHRDLTKSQICSALAYYHDHKQEMDKKIEQDDIEIEEKRRASKQITRQELLDRLKNK
ncbi:DUF433 domain-containing protein [Candidatus Uabimicrobium amorphum]|uniref:DUF433 domain-containing protein n=2 Tax=Uabimicrobium amorphum TaxID=2596890 RepID=A0A5S9F5P9_UABAM|nr:hypothetical protein UABAM_05249 [Candidatus Uabimicrobium amorphum]